MTKKLFRIGIVLGVIALLIYASGGISDLFKTPTAYAVGDLTVDWGVPDGDPIFTVSGAAPGQTETRTVLATNSAPLARPVAVRGMIESDTASMAGVLDITIKEDGTTVYGPTSLAQFFSDSLDPDGIPLSTLNSGATKNYDFELLFRSEAGNEFQSQTIEFDLEIGVAFTAPDECGDLGQYGAPIFGTSGNDKINGGNGNDLIVALEGNDTVSGGNGKDCIIGGSGNNKLDGGNGKDVITAEDGDDIIDGGNESDVISAGNGNNKIIGGNGADLVTSGSGSDKIDLGNDADKASAGDGDDTLDGGNGTDILLGEAGNDKADGGNGKDTCEAEVKKNCEP